jgi:hypothetical protein
MTSQSRTALTLAASLLLFACIHARPTRRGAARRPVQPTTVVVTNHNWATIDVYAVRPGMSIRLGTVETGNSASFRMPGEFETASGDVYLLVDPIGSTRGYVTDRIVFSPGQVIALSVENAINQTTVVVH